MGKESSNFKNKITSYIVVSSLFCMLTFCALFLNFKSDVAELKKNLKQPNNLEECYIVINSSNGSVDKIFLDKKECDNYIQSVEGDSHLSITIKAGN